MAEGEDPFAYKDPVIDDDLDNDDDQEVDRTRPFRPGAASTSYYDGGQYEIQTMMHEQSGLPDTSYEEAPLLGDYQAMNQISWDALTRNFPKASAINLETFYSKTGRLQVKMYGTGKKSYLLYTKEGKTGLERLNPALPKEIIKSLGEIKALKKLLSKTEIPSENNAKDWQKLKNNKGKQRHSLQKEKIEHKRCKDWAKKLKKIRRELMSFKKNMAAILKVKQN